MVDITNSIVEHAAELFATRRHGKQRRHNKLTIDHVKEVVENLRQAQVQDVSVLCVAWLHDAIEDTNTNYDDIYDEFGGVIANCVASLSKDPRLPSRARTRAYELQLVNARWEAKVVKLADILANLQTLVNTPNSTQKHQRKAARLRRYALSIKDGITVSRVPQLALLQKRLDALLAHQGLEPVPLGA